jgi:DNA polymerase-1
MSVTDPPLQTLPRGRVVRDCIIPRDGHVFVMADYSGMEMRVLASFAQEPEMLAAYARGEDLHNFTASKLYGPDFTKPQRTLCKNGGFANIYGAGVAKFATTAEVSLDEAQAFRNMYDSMFPGVKGTPRRSWARHGCGRRQAQGLRHVTLIDGRWLPVEADKAYKGVNFTIQGSCAVVLKQKIAQLDHAGLGPYFRLPCTTNSSTKSPSRMRRGHARLFEEVMPDGNPSPASRSKSSRTSCRWGDHYRRRLPTSTSSGLPGYSRERAASWSGSTSAPIASVSP